MSKKKNKNRTFYCERCGEPHDGSYGSGRFCSAQCARSFSTDYVSEEGRKRQIMALNDVENRKKNRQKIKEAQKRKSEILKEQRKQELAKVSASNAPVNEMKARFKNRTVALGKYGENKIISKCIEHEVPVYIPVVDETGVDMIFDINGEYKKVQVKTSTQPCGVNGDKTSFRLDKSVRTREDCRDVYRKESYGDSVDYFALYDAVNDRSYLIQNESSKSTITISQTEVCGNNQRKGISFADDYDFDRVIEKLKNGINPSDIISIDAIVEDEDDEE